MKYKNLIIIFIFLISFLPKASNAEIVELESKFRKNKSVQLDLEIKARPWTTFVRYNEEFSDTLNNVITVKDALSGELISTFLQGDSNFSKFRVLIPSKYNRDGQLNLNFESLIDLNSDLDIKILDYKYFPKSQKSITYKIDFGRPDDYPFWGVNFSYAEGADANKTWFHNKFFRWAFNPYTLNIPLTKNKISIVDFNIFFPTDFYIRNGDAINTFNFTKGGRFNQDHYELILNPQDSSEFYFESIDPMPGIQADLRELSSAIDSIEVTTLETKKKEEKINFYELFNQRLKSESCKTNSDCNVLDQNDFKNSENILKALARHQFSLGLSNLTNIKNKNLKKYNYFPDAVVVLDKKHLDLLNARYDSGANWLLSTLGAAIALDELGYSVKIISPDEISSVEPKIAYVPSQIFYSGLNSETFWKEIKQKNIHTVIESSPFKEFYNNKLLKNYSGLAIKKNFIFYQYRDDYTDKNGSFYFPAWTIPIFESERLSEKVKGIIKLNALNQDIAYQKLINDTTSIVSVLTPLSYKFYSYGQLGDLSIFKKIINYDNYSPNLKIESSSRVRATLHKANKCQYGIALENNNRGNMAYYGIARAFKIKDPEKKPIALKIKIFPIENITDKSLLINNLKDFKFVEFKSKNCEI